LLSSGKIAGNEPRRGSLLDGVDLRWVNAIDPEPSDLAGAVAVLRAAGAVDSPHRPAHTLSSLTAYLRHGWDGDPPDVAVAHDRGRVVGVLEVELPRWDNQHLGYLDLTVDPVRRREGLGTRLFAVGVEQVRADGRTVVATGGYESAATVGFAKSQGLDRASEEVERRQDLLALDPQVLASLGAEAERASAGYELVRLPSWTPGPQLADVARMTGAINDAPTDDLDVEDEVFTPPRIRAFEVAQLALGRRMYRLAARERTTGALVGQTVVGVDGELPDFGEQYDTSVVPEHRGHRLGLRLKMGMLAWLAEREPQLRVVNTWNAATNDHMIAVNEALGYRVVGRTVVWQRHL
jgi:GNAT superfamily N-acetyltransferase